MVRKIGVIALAAISTAAVLVLLDSEDGPSVAEQERWQNRLRAPNVGDKAPAVKLEYLSNGKTYDLEDNFGRRPTVLIFGSYT